jgi:cobalt-precorrin-5B (C1)-methyltransferase
MAGKPQGPLRRGWTTGACATAATAGVIKDAGDDPDMTHGALVLATVRHGPAGAGVVFRAGPGVGTVTRPGLPVPPGEPAINPVPREMMRTAVAEVAASCGGSGDVVVEIAIADGERLVLKTWNPRHGTVGGLSVLGTTGIVVPFSCSAWIHSIHRGIDVARANGIGHVAGSTGSTSERAVRRLYGLSDPALLDMGDFAGGLLKYLRRHPLPRLTIAGGFGKITKLGQGFLDLHSGRSQVDFSWLAERLAELGADAALVARARGANRPAPHRNERPRRLSAPRPLPISLPVEGPVRLRHGGRPAAARRHCRPRRSPPLAARPACRRDAVPATGSGCRRRRCRRSVFCP